MNSITKYAACAVSSLLLLGACGSEESTATPEEIAVAPDMQAVRDAGRNDALQAVVADSGSTERINAILDIQSKANRLRQEGYPGSAKAYLDAAEAVLDSIL